MNGSAPRAAPSGRDGLLLAVALLLVTVVTACGADRTPEVAANSARASTDTPVVAVVLEAVAFHPADVTVPVGGSVDWRWEDGAIPHNVVAEEFASETQSSGTFTHTFETAGDYPYVCKIHPTMTGTVTVVG